VIHRPKIPIGRVHPDDEGSWNGKVLRISINLDELGSAEWDDRKVRKVIVLAEVRKEDA
jgi:hypothetical protein